MDSNTQQTVDINLKDLLFVFLKRVGIALFVGIVIAGLFGGYKYTKDKTSSASSTNVLDLSNRLNGESDAAYSARVIEVNRAEDIVNSVESLYDQIDIQRDYVANSLLMQIDTTNEAVTNASVVFTIGDDTKTGMIRALVSSYSLSLRSVDYLDELANEYGIDQRYLKELINVTYDVSDSIMVSEDKDSEVIGTLTITVIGSDCDCTEKIMECVLEEMESIYAEYNETVVPHTYTVAGTQSFYTVDNNTRDLQYNAAIRIETIQKQIGYYNESLDQISSSLGVGSREDIYNYFLFGNGVAISSSIDAKSYIKYAFIGFIAGFLIVLAVVAVDYVFGKKFATQAKFFGRFPNVQKVGVAKPSNKRLWLARLIDEKTGDDNKLSEDTSIKLLAANVKNLSAEMDKVLFIGTAETSRIKDLVTKMEVKVDVKESIFADPTCLASISDYDGVVLVEQRNYSDCRLVAEEIKLINNANTKLIGVIVI